MNSLEAERALVFDWFKTYISLIHSSMNGVYQTKKHQNTIFGYFDLKERMFSEMPLCETWFELPLPQGFWLKNPGKIIHNFMGLTIEPQHFYIESDQGNIGRLNFAAYINPVLVRARPGKRIAIVENLLPEAVCKYPEHGIAIMVENREVVQNSLGLAYS